MFLRTRVLLKGLVWKKKFWSPMRKTRARVIKKRLDATETCLRMPYTSMNVDASGELTREEMNRRINGYPRSWMDIVNQNFIDLSKKTK